MSKKGSRVPKVNQAGVALGGSAARTMKRARSVGEKRKAGAGAGNTVEAMLGAQGGGALVPSTAIHMSAHHGAHPAFDGIYAPSPLMAAPPMGAPPYPMHANALLLPRPHDPSVHRMHGLAVGGDALAATGTMPPGAYDYASFVPMDATSRPQMMGGMPGHAVSSSHTSVSQLTQQNIADFMKMQHQATVGARAAQLAPLQPSLPPTHLAHMPHPHAQAHPQQTYGYAHSAPAAAPVAMSPMPLAQPPPAPGQSAMSHYGPQPHHPHQHQPPPHPAPAYRPVTNTSYQSSLEEERKRQKRALNRQSAQRCRKRKRAMLDDLKRTNKVFSAHAAILDSLNSMSIEFRVQTGAITFAQGTRHLGWEPSEVQQTNIYSYLEPSTRLRVDKVIRQLIDDWENTTNESGSSGQDPSSGSDSGGSSETTTTTCNDSNGSGITSKSGSTNGDSGDNSSDGSRSGEEGKSAARGGVGTVVGGGSGGGSAACSGPSTGTPPTSGSPSPPQQPTPPRKPSPMTDALAASQACLPSDVHISAAAGEAAKKSPPFKPVSSSKAGCSSQGNGAGGEEASKSSSAGSGTGTGVTSTTTTTSLSKGRTISSSSLDPISEVQSDPSSAESSASALANRFTSREPGSSTNSNISQLLPFGHPASKEFTFQITKVDFLTRTHGCLRGEVNAVMTFEQSQGGGEHECLWSVRFYDIQPSHLRHHHKRRRQDRGQVGSAGLHVPPSKPHSHSPPPGATQKAGAAQQVHGSSVPAVTYSGSRGGLNPFMGSSSSGDHSPNTRASTSEDSGTPPPVGVHGEGEVEREEDHGAAVTLD